MIVAVGTATSGSWVNAPVAYARAGAVAGMLMALAGTLVVSDTTTVAAVAAVGSATLGYWVNTIIVLTRDEVAIAGLGDTLGGAGLPATALLPLVSEALAERNGSVPAVATRSLSSLGGIFFAATASPQPLELPGLMLSKCWN